MQKGLKMKVVKKLKKVQAISERTGKPKIIRQDRGLAAIKASKMTKAEWLRYQTPKYKEAWPKPEYMFEPRKEGLVRDGGEGPYRWQSFELVTRWTAETRISYRPHAKAPGSKSHLRYEKYSKAKTVGQSLALGAYPIDWIYDYEHGFIKVTGGKIRDEPIDRSKVERDDQLSAVDKALESWFIRELCRRCKLERWQLTLEKGCTESVFVRAHRLVANRKADEILKKAAKQRRAVSTQEVTDILKAWSISKNPFRVNVMPEGQKFVKSDTLGLLRDRGRLIVTRPAREYPNVAKLIARWLHGKLPKQAKQFKFTSLNLNCNYAARDGNNFGPSMIKAFGEFTGGELSVWPEDDKSGSLKTLPEKKKNTLDISKNLALFNGNMAHEVADFEGSRYSVVYFTAGCHAKMPDDVRQQLKDLDFMLPKKAEKRYSVLRAPTGYFSKVSKPKGPAVMTWRVK
ncbi:unnamed protein product [Symbiodinium pilosum]|uniref:Uncharacterized protein n=1 Tax=Symbiodinium pilosum TaxID=2952 RepID=A0A812IR54_SYMPI|nr:unnamed protein product [Symbiodinium pilosum]